MDRLLRLQIGVAATVVLLAAPEYARAWAGGTEPAALETVRVFGSASVTGDALMDICADQPETNCYLLPESDASITNLPFDAQIERAYLWWSGSTDVFVDDTADFTLPDGTRYVDLPADHCYTIADSLTHLGDYFYCRRNVTDLVRAMPVGSYNGRYVVGNVQARTGEDCNADPNCQARYAGWSLVLIWSSPTTKVVRDITLYDGFYGMDEDKFGSGLGRTFTLSGFYVGSPARAEFTFFGLEGDRQLGVPPQDQLPPDHYLYSTTARDFMEFNGHALEGPGNPAGNLWNSTNPGGGRGLGIDIDTFNVGDGGLALLHPGDTQATMKPGSGDGIPANPPREDLGGEEQGFGGELVFVGYLLLAVDTVAPNFRGVNTSKAVDRLKASPGDVLTYTITVTNEGTAAAHNVVITDQIPAHATYVANSTVTDCGANDDDIAGRSPLETGLNLGTLNFVGDNNCIIQFQARISADAPAGGYIENHAAVDADEVQPSDTNTVRTEVAPPVIGTPTKKAIDINGAPARPGDRLRYNISIPNPADRELRGVTFEDDLPLHVNLLDPQADIIVSSGTVVFTPPRKLRVENMAIPSQGAGTITIFVTLDTEAEFAAKEPGVPINGYEVLNQGKIYANGLPSPGYKPTDDPDTYAPNDPTRVVLQTSIGPQFVGSTKAVNGGSGRNAAPGELLTYTLKILNSGSSAAQNVVVKDRLLDADGLLIESAGQGGVIAAVTGGKEITWNLGVINGGAAPTTLTFTARVAGTVVNGQALANQAAITASGGIAAKTDDPETAGLGDPTVVFALTVPLFDTSTKSVSGDTAGRVSPGDKLFFTITVKNTGNGGAANLVITDPIDVGLTSIGDITPTGGVYDAQRRVLTWNIPSLGVVPEQLTLGFSAVVATPPAPAYIIRNRATIQADGTGQFPTNEVALAVNDAAVFTSSTKQIIDINGDGVYSAGDQISFRLTIINSGTAEAREVKVTDVFEPSAFTGLQASGGTVDGSIATWTLGTLGPSSRRVLTASATLSANLASGAQVCNQASITSPDLSGAAVTDNPDTVNTLGDTTCLTITALPSFTSATKQVEDLNGGDVKPGDQLLYTIRITNTGSANANDVVVEDPVPPELENIQFPAGGRLDADRNVIEFDKLTHAALTLLVPGATATMAFTGWVKGATPNGTIISNQARIGSREIPDSRAYLTDDYAKPGEPISSTNVVVVSGGKVTDSTKTVTTAGGQTPSQVKPGDELIYTIQLKNTGTADLANVTIEDVIEPGLTLEPSTVTRGGKITGSVIRWDQTTTPELARVSPGTTIDFSFRVLVAAPSQPETKVTNQATISAIELADKHILESPVLPVVGPVLNGSTKDFRDLNGEPAVPGDQLEYIITILNSGSSAANNITVTDANVGSLPLTSIQVQNNGRFENGAVVWDYLTSPELRSPLLPGASVELRFSGIIAAGTPNNTRIENQAGITIPGFDRPVKTDNPRTPEVQGDKTVVVVNFGSLRVTKTVTDQNAGNVNPGDQLVWNIEVTNTSDQAIAGLVVEDPIDANLTQVTWTGGGALTGSTVTWNRLTTPELAKVDPGGVVKFTITSQVKNGLADGTVIADQVKARADGVAEVLSDDPNTPEANDPTKVTVASAPVLAETTKTYVDLNGGEILPGDTLRYFIDVPNTGNAEARDITIRDPLPTDYLDEIKAEEGGQIVTEDGQQVIKWEQAGNSDLARLAPGQNVRVSFTARVKPELTDNREIANQAFVSSPSIAAPEPSDDPNTPAPNDPTVVRVIDRPYLARSTKEVKIQTTSPDGRLRPGDRLLYVLTVINTGSQPATNVKLFDPLPIRTAYVPASTTLNGKPVADLAGQSPLFKGGLTITSARDGTASGTIVPDDGQAPYDERATITFLVRVERTTPNGTSISNQGEMIAAETNAVTDNPLTADVLGDATTVVVGGGPDISATVKTVALVSDAAANGIADVNDKLRYTVMITNSGDAPVNGGIFRDQLPDQVSYVPGTLTLNGVPLTDAADSPGDPGEYQSAAGTRGAILVYVPTLAAGQSASITFDVNVLAEPLISNQGSVEAPGLAAEPTDDDGIEDNGDNPTVTPVGSGTVAKLEMIKLVRDQNGGAVQPGDQLRYSVELRNQGNTTLTGLTVTDEIPANTAYVGGEDALPQGTQLTAPQRGSGRYQRGTWRVAGMTLEPGKNLRLAFSVALDKNVARGTRIANLAQGSAKELAKAVNSNEAAVMVGGIAGTAALRGLFYFNRDGKNGFSARDDKPLGGYTALVEAASPQNAGGQALRLAATASRKQMFSAMTTEKLLAGERNNFLIPDLPPGRWRLRVVSNTGVTLLQRELNDLEGGTVLDLNLPFEPTGIVYRLDTGEPLPNVIVSVRYDPTDSQASSQPVPSELLLRGQQGQRTDENGFYRFDLPPDRRYQLVMASGTPSFTAPAPSRPPQAEILHFEAARRVSPNAEPNVAKDGLYYLRLEPATNKAGLSRNHLPVEPLRDLITIQKTANKSEITIGDIVTYTVILGNNSAENIETSEFGNLGGVYVVDAIPAGFDYVKNSGYAGIAGLNRTASFRPAPAAGERLLRFGPFDLPAGGALTLRYQLVAGSSIKPGEYENRAQAEGAGGVPYSKAAHAKVRVIRDPIFDDGLVIGKVFCDENGNDWQDSGEFGIGGARVFLDNGVFAVTDPDGKYHAAAIEAGYHLLKLDDDTLPPGSAVTSEQTVGRLFTRGIVHKINFAVACAYETVRPTRFIEGHPATPTEITLYAKLTPPAVHIGETALTWPTLDLEWPASGAERPSPVFARGERGLSRPAAIRVVLDPAASPTRWALRVTDVTGNLVWAQAGAGRPPSPLAWEGRTINGDSAPPGAYFIRLEIVTPDGDLVLSPRRSLAIGDSGPQVFAQETISTALFAEDGITPGPEMQEILSRLAAKAREVPDAKVAVAAYTDSAGDPAEKKARTRMQARAVQTALVKLGVPGDRIEARGLGDDQPLRQEETLRDRIANRRLEIRLVREGVAASPVEPPAIIPAVLANGYQLDPAGAPEQQQTVPLKNGLLNLDYRLPNGGRLQALVRVFPGHRAAAEPEKERPDGWSASPAVPANTGPVPASGNLSNGTIRLGARDYRLPGREFSLALLEGVEEGKGPVVAIKGVKDLPVARWRISLIDSQGAEARAGSGAGKPPATFDLSAPTETMILAPGAYRLVAEVVTEDKQQITTPPLLVNVPGPEDRLSLPLSVFASGSDQIDAHLRARITSAARRLVAPEGNYLVTVPLSGEKDGPELAVRRARALKKELAALGASPPRIKMQVARPEEGQAPESLGPMVIERQREATEVAKLAPLVQIGLEKLAVAAPGEFKGEVPYSPGDETGRLEVTAVDLDGRKYSLRFPAPPAPMPGVPVATPAGPEKRMVSVKDFPVVGLTAILPPAGGVYRTQEITVHGVTAPRTMVTVNGQKADVFEDGTYQAQVILPEGPGTLTIQAVDAGNNSAIIEQPIAVDTDRFFLMVLGEGTAGQTGGEPDGMKDFSTVRPEVWNRAIFMHGRSALYLKGQVKGETLFKQYRFTAHGDTDKEWEREFFRQTIDPNKYYPVYGDTAAEVQDVNAKGKVYVLLEADHSNLLVGNYQTNIDGPEFFRYERTYYGAQLDFNETLGGNYGTRLRGFATKGEDTVRHRSVVMEATGGTLYYLKDRDLVEGSETVRITVRDRQTGIPLAETVMRRDLDYNLDYASGRLQFKQPVNMFSNQPGQIIDGTGGAIMPGHPEYVSIDYDYLDLFNQGAGAYGLHLRETFWDTVTVGGGYLREGQGRDGDDAYRLWGTELGVKYGQKTKFLAEFARSHSRDGLQFFSDDGGLTYRMLGGNETASLLAQQQRLDGNAYKAEWSGEVAEYTGAGDDFLAYSLYFRNLEPGFFANGTRLEQGFMKYGGLTRWLITKQNEIMLRHDGLDTTIAMLNQLEPRHFMRQLSLARYTRYQGDWTFAGEYAHSYYRDNYYGGGLHGDVAAAGAGYLILPAWKVYGEQEIVLNADPRLYPTPEDQYTSTVGTDYRLKERLTMSAAESVRPSGANATMAGLKLAWADNSNVYANERLFGRQNRFLSTSVLGVEETASPTARTEVRTYGEYQVDAANAGEVNRAVLGMNNRWEVWGGLYLLLNYERQQVTGADEALYRPPAPQSRGLISGQNVVTTPQTTDNPMTAAYEPDPTAIFDGLATPYGSQVGDMSRDAAAVGFEFLRLDRYKMTGRYEIRYDNNDENWGGMDSLQFLTTNGLAWAVTRDLSLLGMMNYVITQNLNLARKQGEVLEAAAGLALRPARYDWINILLKYSKVLEQRPYDLSAGILDRSNSDIITIAPIVDTPWRFEIAEKFALKHVTEQVAELPTATSDTILWINRLNVRLWRHYIVLGGEYRILANFLADDMLDGYLVELTGAPVKYMRLGLGYNFTSFTDNEFARQDRDYSGFFFRMTGQY